MVRFWAQEYHADHFFFLFGFFFGRAHGEGLLTLLVASVVRGEWSPGPSLVLQNLSISVSGAGGSE